MATAKSVALDHNELILAYLAHQHLVTRLRERSLGDFHDCPILPAPIREAGISSQMLITMLEHLHLNNLVVKSESVHAFDSSEYRVVWIAK